jgi:cation diffusion facilitator family transporter
VQSQNEHSHHEHSHTGEHSHPLDHSDNKGVWGWITTALHLHPHSHHAEGASFIETEEGIRVVWLALAALTITSILQVIIVLASGSVALFADTAHNIVDGLNSIPLLIAFYLARRSATRRYTYGYARAEDVAGIFIVLSIAVSAGDIFWESFQKLLHPEPLNNLGWVAAAAVIGFLGNEVVAQLQIRTGRKIGSAALVADGLHARTDGFTSLAVLIAVGGSWIGLPIIDPIIGLLIGITILFITRDAAIRIWQRLMDAIEPEIMEQAEAVIHEQAEVKALQRLRMRWLGHTLYAEVQIAVEPSLTTAESFHITEHLRHDLFHEVDHLAEVVVNIEPWSENPGEYARVTAHPHHEPHHQHI